MSGMRLATRGSALALAQARAVGAAVGEHELVEVGADGGGGDKSRFVRGVERALLEGRADVGVHSAKDLPSEEQEGLAIAAVPRREDPRDAWLGPGRSLEDVPAGTVVGTASLRRRAQLLAARPDLRVRELHGNVDTRLAKLAAGEVDALVLAVAGLRRLGREEEIAFAIPAETMVPAPGQGALALQIRSGDAGPGGVGERLAAIGDAAALAELSAERAAVALLEASCWAPLGVHARLADGQLRIEAFVGLPDGDEWLRDRVETDADDPRAAGAAIAERLLAAGAGELLERAEAASRASLRGS